ncbi:MAG: precorrin-3B synthase [Pseudomonadota bacterium]
MSGVAATDPGFAVQGWCPGALRPMLSGDGLVVRVRPRLGRFTADQAAGIARAAAAHGSGVMDVTSRANLQIRGVSADAHPALIADLDALGLVDPTEALEARRNIVVSPFADDAAMAVACRVEEVLPFLPTLPGKFGFAIDCGSNRVLAEVSADIRVERDATGGLLVRADGMTAGWRTEAGTIADDIRRIARAFVDAGGGRDGASRMTDLTGRGSIGMALIVAALGPAVAVPAPVADVPMPGLYPQGALIGFAFGQTDAAMLGTLAMLGPVRPTPWRMVLVEGLTHMPGLPGLIIDPDDPLRRVVACTGAPGCPQGLAPTRALARALAAAVPAGKTLHVSGCAKGCAHSGVADVTLVAARDGFQAIRGGTARDAASTAPVATDALTADPALIKDLF